MKYIFALFFSLFLSVSMFSQVNSPDIYCVNNDTIYWGLPNNACTAFVSYDIYYSSEQNGPFDLLTQVTDPNQTSFFHLSVNNTYYYYILSNYNCPGETVISSDTINNLQPPVVNISSASVSDNDIILEWEPVDAPNITGYIIYHKTNVGVVPLDTLLSNETTYTDITANPTAQPEEYYILSLNNNCGLISIFNSPHQTMRLEANHENCSGHLTLQWSEYIGWTEGVEKYEILQSTNSGSYEVIASVAGDSTSFQVNQLIKDNSYCYTIKAYQENGDYSAISNESCLTINESPVNDFTITNITILPNEQVELYWSWDKNGNIVEYNINRSNDAENLSPVSTEIPDILLPIDNRYIDTNADINQQLYYSLNIIDGCAIAASTPINSPIFAQAKALETGGDLVSWTPLQLENTIVNFYEIFLIEEGNILPLGTVQGDSTSFIYPLEIQENKPETCYYVEANSTVNLFNGEQLSIQSLSNKACAIQNPKIYVPNAFAPNGINKVFKPVILFSDYVDFEMTIYNRYGEMIFNTQDLRAGWNGQNTLQGTYVYHIKITKQDGKEINKNGTVLLLK